jgi:putrescine transport system ATP-binding protein
VADFIGSANILEGQIVEDSADHVRVLTDIGELNIEHSLPVQKGAQVWVALRPEKIHLSAEAPSEPQPNQSKGIVEDIGYLGNSSIYKIRLESGRIIDVTAPNQIRPKSRSHGITWEDTVYLTWDPSSVMLLNK